MLSRETLPEDRYTPGNTQITSTSQGDAAEQPAPHVNVDVAGFYVDAELKKLREWQKIAGFPYLSPESDLSKRMKALEEVGTITETSSVGDSVADVLARLDSDKARRDALEYGFQAGKNVWEEYKQDLCARGLSISGDVEDDIKIRVTDFNNALLALQYSKEIQFPQRKSKFS